MSETKVTQFVEKLQGLVKDEAYLSALVADLRGEVEQEQNKLEKLRGEQAGIRAGIQEERDAALAEVEEAKKNSDRIFQQEDRRIKEADERSARLSGESRTESERLRVQKNNQDDREVKLLASGKKLAHLKGDLEEKEAMLSAKEDDINVQIQRNTHLLEEIKANRKGQQDEKNDLENVRSANQQTLRAIKRRGSALDEREKALDEREKALDEREQRQNTQADQIARDLKDCDEKTKAMRDAHKAMKDKEPVIQGLLAELDYKILCLEKAGVKVDVPKDVKKRS